jgi:hypothetical protein
MTQNPTRNIMLHYPRKLADKPIISNLIREYDITVNITRARIDQDEEGTLVIEISGSKKNIDAGLDYLRELGISFKPVSKIIRRIDERCTHCSAWRSNSSKRSASAAASAYRPVPIWRWK